MVKSIGQLTNKVVLRGTSNIIPLLFKHINMQERNINHDYLRNSVSELFGERVGYMKIDPIEEGFSNRAYKLSLIRKDEVENYFIKEIEDQREYLLYTELICPMGISAPQVYGILRDGIAQFLLMEHVDHVKTRWEDEKAYYDSIDLLIKKDQLARSNWSIIKKSPLVNNGIDYGKIIRNVSKIHEGRNMGIHSSYNSLSDYLQRSEKKLMYMQHMLSSEGTLTMCHNDFHLNNVIFSRTNGKVYLIDWTKPSVGSVFIDLAKMVNIAPDKYQRNLIEYYEQRLTPEKFNELYPLAEAYDHLGVISWVVDAVKARKKEILQFINFDQKSGRLIQILSGISI